MRRDELFEVLEPPPHGLTRLRGKLASRRANRLLWPALVLASAAAAVLLFLPKSEAPAEFSAALAMEPGPPVSALDGQSLGLERLPSGNPKVVLYRVAVLSGSPPR